MTKHFLHDDDIQRVGLGLTDHTLPKREWTHAAHFAAALWFLRHHPEIALARRMPALIRSYNEATGVRNTDDSGYHETITLASIDAARAFLSKHPDSRPLHEIVDLMMETRLGRADWILAYWTKSRLFSAESRRRWIEPDIRPWDRLQ